MASQTSSVLDVPISLFRGTRDNGTPFASPLLSEVLGHIQQGRWRDTIAALRQTLHDHGEAVYKQHKERLIAMTPACAMRTRDKNVPLEERIASPSNLVHFDLDKLPDHDRVKTLLTDNPHVAFVFTSPRGNGLKIGIAAHGITVTNYKRAWHHLLRELQQRYPSGTFVEDPNIKYIHALCFIADDPGLYANPQAVPWVIPPQAHAGTGGGTTRRPWPAPQTSASDEQARIADALQAIPADDYETWVQVGMALHSTGEASARALWDTWSMQSDKYDAAMQEQKWASFRADGGTTIATLFYVAGQYGYVLPLPATLLLGGQSAQGRSGQATPTAAGQAPRPHVVHHVLPDYILTHPDPRVQKHWKRIYRQTAIRKERYAREGGLPW
jgi:Primase C terminal 2 (PriCT-2)/BT4734-like, N-terminal domain